MNQGVIVEALVAVKIAAVDLRENIDQGMINKVTAIETLVNDLAHRHGCTADVQSLFEHEALRISGSDRHGEID